jgi:hypothetical protein
MLRRASRIAGALSLAWTIVEGREPKTSEGGVTPAKKQSKNGGVPDSAATRGGVTRSLRP